MKSQEKGYILAIESSCDESAAAVLSFSGTKIKVLSNIISSQIDIHSAFGGVIPEIAAREHVLKILPTIDSALKTAKVSHSRLSAIAVTSGPGLISSLLAGVETARALSLAWNISVIPVNHILGHIFSNFIEGTNISFPAIVLTVSGGHNSLVKMSSPYSYKTIGETLDDAAGEAYDKAAKMLGLGYPGGPIISARADQFRKTGKLSDIVLPRPMIHSPSYDFSFSGLKTALLYTLKKDKSWKTRVDEYAFAFEEAAVEVLVKKTFKAAKKFKAKIVLLSGGVSANKRLREAFILQASKDNMALKIAPMSYTTDNAAMIGAAGVYLYLKGKSTLWQKLRADSSLEL